MKLVPKSPQNMYPPNGGYGFVEPKTGMKFNGLHSSVRGTAIKIVEHRRANPKLFPESHWYDLDSVEQEVYAQKHATMPELFIGFGPADPQMFPSADKCSCEKPDLEPIYCPTCSGKRITGYRCKTCGKNK